MMSIDLKKLIDEHHDELKEFDHLSSWDIVIISVDQILKR